MKSRFRIEAIDSNNGEQVWKVSLKLTEHMNKGYAYPNRCVKMARLIIAYYLKMIQLSQVSTISQ